MTTRSQQMMAQAIENVKSIKDQPQTAKIYGRLCHKFPVLVRTCGLCQAIAFIESKRTSSDKDKDRQAAHTYLTNHVKSVLNEQGFTIESDPSEAIAKWPMMEYALATRTVLGAWIYYKRFAESILGVEDASEGEES